MVKLKKGHLYKVDFHICWYLFLVEKVEETIFYAKIVATKKVSVNHVNYNTISLSKKSLKKAVVTEVPKIDLPLYLGSDIFPRTMETLIND